MSRNIVSIEGGLTRDPDFGYGQGHGIAYWRGNLAVNGTRYDSQTRQQVVTTVFAQTVAFGYQAEQLKAEGLVQGDSLLGDGQLGQNTFEKKDGTKETKTQVEVLNFTVLRKKFTQNTAQYTHQPQEEETWSTGPADPSAFLNPHHGQ